MKKLLLSGIAALFLATGAVNAEEVDMCPGPSATEIPCSKLGREYMSDRAGLIGQSSPPNRRSSR